MRDSANLMPDLLLPYAGPIEDDGSFEASRPLAVRLWWMGVIWSATIVGSMACIWGRTVLARDPFEGPLWLLPEIGSTMGAAGVLVLLLARRQVLDHTVFVASGLTLLCLLAWFVPYGLQVGAQAQLRGATYATVPSIEALGLYLGWWMALIGLLIANLLRRPESRLRHIFRSPQRFAIALAFFSALSLTIRELAKLGYVATDPQDRFWQTLRRADWMTIAIRAGLLLIASAMLVLAMWSSRLSGPKRYLVIAAILIVIVTMIIDAVAMRLHNRFSPGQNRLAWSMQLVDDLLWYPMNLAPMLPALTWPRMHEVAGGTPIR